MRTRDPRVFLADALDAVLAIRRFMGGCTSAEYASDVLLRSAVERQFEIVGEALRRTLAASPALIGRLPEAPKVIGFRNVLAHGYDTVDNDTVYELARAELPLLEKRLGALLEEIS